jgi:hypothetical protein
VTQLVDVFFDGSRASLLSYLGSQAGDENSANHRGAEAVENAEGSLDIALL